MLEHAVNRQANSAWSPSSREISSLEKGEDLAGHNLVAHGDEHSKSSTFLALLTSSIHN